MQRLWLALLAATFLNGASSPANEPIEPPEVKKTSDKTLANTDLTPLVRNIGSRRELMVDDFLVERHQGAEFRMHRPEPREVAITCDAPWEGNTSAYFTLFGDDGLFRMYYRGSHFDEKTKKETHPEFACYAESRDGLRFEKPKLGLFEFNGAKENNIVRAGTGTHNFTPFKDANPKAPNAARYKALASTKGGLLAFHSPDGVRWSLMREIPVITHGAFDSQNLAFWDPVRSEYRAYWRYFTAGKLDETGKKQPGIRAIRTAISKDFLSWTDEAELQYGDAPDEHLYTNAIAPYARAPHLFVGFPTRFQPQTQQVEPVLMTSRDGVTFKRWTEPLIPITAPKDRDGNRSNYMAWGILQLPGQDRELSVYAKEAYYAGPGSRIRRFTFRTDGFVSLHAGDETAEVVTRPLLFDGKKLTVNYAAEPGGSLHVEIQDADGAALSGFTLKDCRNLDGDAIDHTVSWTKSDDVSPLAGRPIRLRFVLKNADLYALRFVP